MEAYALYSYEASSNTEISFSEGDTLKILKDTDPEWYFAESYGQDGYVPVTYVQFNRPQWYRNVTKAEAVAMLGEKAGNASKHPKGSFIVRPSESGLGDVSITVRINSVEHFKILRNNGEYYVWRAAPHFSSINQLIDHYRSNSISKTEKVLLKDMKLETVHVNYDYKAQTTEEIDIYAGEKITLFDDSNGDWWTGQIERDGVTYRGLFPANYVSK